MYTFKFNLRLFDDPNPNPNPNPNPAPAPQPGQQGGSPEIDYDKLAEIMAGKADAAMRGYFKQQGLSKEEADAAIAAYKAEKAKNDPTEQNKALQAQVEEYQRKEVLGKLNVRTEDYDYVAYKAQQKMTDGKTTFEQAATAFLKENPRFVNGQGSYRVSTGSASTGSAEQGGNTNDDMNATIRKAFGRN